MIEFSGARLSFRAAIIGCQTEMQRLDSRELDKAAVAVKEAVFDGANGIFGFTVDSERGAARALRKMATEGINETLGTLAVSDVIFFDVEYVEPPH